MNKTQQLLQERSELFDKEFVEERTPIENTKGEFTCKVIASAKNIKSFHATTISLLLNSLKDEVSQLKDSLQGLGMSQEAGEILEAFFESFLSQTISNIQTK